ncbi:MAG: hypothetical protein V8Q91_16420 [Bilophila wadsworthia]|jgi:hypothetical protein|uniref:hypothetical protein n=1 Tax=Bilophila wadsworthia TaxID=35833 RepID=UPI00283BB3BC|nr:hypothetical protein [Bilophila sp.]
MIGEDKPDFSNRRRYAATLKMRIVPQEEGKAFVEIRDKHGVLSDTQKERLSTIVGTAGASIAHEAYLEELSQAQQRALNGFKEAFEKIKKTNDKHEKIFKILSWMFILMSIMWLVLFFLTQHLKS